VIATFGFLRPHKGLLELVEAVDILRRVFPGLRLLAQTALYPSEESSAYLGAVTARIAALGLQDVVFLDPNFVDIDVAIARLAAARVVVLPYAVSDEGASAAAAAALAARRPLITTQARIFDEVRGVAYTAEDNAPAVLAAAIGTVLAVPGLRAYLEARVVRAASERQWHNVARELLRATTVSGTGDEVAVHVAGIPPMPAAASS
jgi:glycosyltransferase involved in cell wall biosynthesis